MSGCNSISIVNNGLGVAIIDKIEIYVDGILMGAATSNDVWQKAFKKVVTVDFSPNCQYFNSNYPMKAGSSIDVMVINDISSDDAMGIFDRFDLLVTYRSIYKESFSKNLN
ncbi:MAG: hypothetical protein ACERIH_09280 [Labilibaculum antarcticum]